MHNQRTMSDLLLVFAIALAFAIAATSHAAILAGMLRRRQFKHALLALLLPPLSLYWAYTEGMRTRGTILLSSTLVYVATLSMAILRG